MTASATAPRRYYKRQRSIWELLPTLLLLVIAVYLIGQGLVSQIRVLIFGGLALLVLVALLVIREITLRSTAEDGTIARIRPFFLSKGQEDSRFKRLIDGRTAILISHRFSTVKMADRILVLDNGAIAETGSHAELVALGGQYAELYEQKARNYR